MAKAATAYLPGRPGGKRESGGIERMAAVERIAYARLFSTVAGLFLVVIGLAGFVTPAGFRNPEITSDLLGLYPVNGWANGFHVLAGLVGLGLARPLPRLFALLAGVVFLTLGVAGILAPNGVLLLDGLPATRSVNLVNLAIGALGLSAYAASRWDRLRKGIANLVLRLERRLDRRRQKRRRRRAARRRRPGASGGAARTGGAGRTGKRAGATSRAGSGDADRPAPGPR